MSRKLNFQSKLTRTKITVHEDHYTFLTISRSLIRRMRNVSDKNCREDQNSHFVFNIFFVKIVPFVR